MRLIYTKASPYARKARIAIIEKNLENEIKLQEVDFQTDMTLLRAINPLGKVPALITTEGDSLFDSPVICKFIDSLSSVSPLIPGKGKAHFDVLTDEALADGLVDIAVSKIMFERYSGQAYPEVLVERNYDAMHRALNQMESRVADFGDAFDLGQISFLTAVEYLAFRYPDFDWQDMRPTLTKWYRAHASRKSVVSTRPN